MGGLQNLLAARDGNKLPTYMIRVRTGNEEEVYYFKSEEEVRAFALRIVISVCLGKKSRKKRMPV